MSPQQTRIVAVTISLATTKTVIVVVIIHVVVTLSFLAKTMEKLVQLPKETVSTFQARKVKLFLKKQKFLISKLKFSF